jgi:hypothetical protein
MPIRILAGNGRTDHVGDCSGNHSGPHCHRQAGRGRDYEPTKRGTTPLDWDLRFGAGNACLVGWPFDPSMDNGSIRLKSRHGLI